MGVPFTSAISINGLSWLGVEHTASFLSGVTISQAQPDPKRVAPASLTLVLKSANEPNVLFMALPSAPEGSPPPPGDSKVQNNVWLKCPPPLLRTAIGYFDIFLMISSILLLASGFPSRALFKLVT